MIDSAQHLFRESKGLVVPIAGSGALESLIHQRSGKSSRGGWLALLVVLGFASGCHFGDARHSCDELAQSLYEARQPSDRARMEAILTSPLLADPLRDSLVSTMMERDARFGPQVSRRSYLSVTHMDREYDDLWYRVRLGFNLHYVNGETSEEITCRADWSGKHVAIIEVKFGPEVMNK